MHFIRTPSSRLAVPQSPRSTPGPSSLQEFGIKHLQVKLIIPAELVQRVSYLYHGFFVALSFAMIYDLLIQ